MLGWIDATWRVLEAGQGVLAVMVAATICYAIVCAVIAHVDRDEARGEVDWYGED